MLAVWLAELAGGAEDHARDANSHISEPVTRACEELGRAPRTEVYDGFDATAFVVSLNLHRRHLDESQRAKVAAKLANMKVGGDRVSEHSANLQNGAVSQSRAAELLNVGTRTWPAVPSRLHRCSLLA